MSNTVFRDGRNGFHAFKEILGNEGMRGRTWVRRVRGNVSSIQATGGFHDLFEGVLNQYTRRCGEKLNIIEDDELNIDDIDDNVALKAKRLAGCALGCSGFITTPLDAVEMRFKFYPDGK